MDNQNVLHNGNSNTDNEVLPGIVSPSQSSIETIDFANLIENSPFPVAVFDRETRILAASAPWIRAGKLAGKQWLGQYLRDICHEAEFWESKHLMALNGESFQAQEQQVFIPIYHLPQYINWHIRPWRKADGSIGGTVISVQNMTESVLTRKNLQKSLEQEEEAKRIKSEFLSNISHELRTPLNGILGFTGLAIDSESNSGNREYLEIVRASAEKLLNIVNNVLDFSNTESGSVSLELQKIPLCELIREVVESTSQSIHKKGLEMLVRFVDQQALWVYIDVTRVKQILIILIGNATKFTHHGEIELCVVTHVDPKSETGSLTFSVRDTGIGIEKAEVGKIMQAFTQVESPSTKHYEGAGLGLAIASNLLKIMNSKMDVESMPEMGSIFSFNLQLRAQYSEVNSPITLDSARRVLIVDDNRSTREIIEEILSSLGILCDHANNGKEAVALVESGAHYDVVLMEHDIADMNLMEAARKLKSLAGHVAPEIILMHTSLDDATKLQEDTKFLIKSLIQKPVRYQDLILSLSDFDTDVKSKKAGDNAGISNLRQKISLPITVLMVEDNLVNMMLLRKTLRKLIPDAQLIEAGNGLTAVNICQHQLPDIVFMDVQMPVMNGLDATKNIRLIKNSENLPIVALTAGNEKGAREKCLDAGMDEFLTKPYTPKDLLKVFHNFKLI